MAGAPSMFCQGTDGSGFGGWLQFMAEVAGNGYSSVDIAVHSFNLGFCPLLVAKDGSALSICGRKGHLPKSYNLINVMKRVLRTLLAVLLIGAGGNARAQQYTKSDLYRYFAGSWKGTGKFASGKEISADLSFSVGLDSAFLVSRHKDLAPNRFLADGYWKVDAASGKVSVWLFDNSGEQRLLSGDGLHNDSLVISRSFEVKGRGNVVERFVYQITDASHFRMAYEVSVGEKPWRMVDYLIFERKK